MTPSLEENGTLPIKTTSTKPINATTNEEKPAPAPAPVARHVPDAPSSAMAGLSLDGTKRGANRVGTWLNHVKIDPEATNTQAEGVEVDDWRCDGTMVGID